MNRDPSWQRVRRLALLNLKPQVQHQLRHMATNGRAIAP